MDIIYNPSTYTFQIALPETGEIVAEAVARPDAEMAYLRVVAPELARKTDHCAGKFPALTDRARRAAFIVLAGHVAAGRGIVALHGRMHRTPVEGARGRGSQPEPYSITEARGVLICNCPDFADAGAPVVEGTRYCKHVLAY